MKWIDVIAENEAKRKLVESAIDDLNSVGFFGALMEFATDVNKPAPIKVGTEQYALRAAWMDGAMDMLKNVYEFKERFVLAKEPARSFKPDFGAKERMVKNKDFNTSEEYQTFIKE